MLPQDDLLAVKDPASPPITGRNSLTSAQSQNFPSGLCWACSLPSLSSSNHCPTQQPILQYIKQHTIKLYPVISSIPRCHRRSLSCKPRWGVCDFARMPFSPGQPFEYFNRPSTILYPFRLLPAIHWQHSKIITIEAAPVALDSRHG